jgi:hypothetical protein
MAIDASGSTAGAEGLDLNSLLQSAIAGKNMGNIFGGGDNAGSGLIGGLILGSLLRNNGNLLGGNDGAVATRAATPNDVQDTVGFINTIQDINAARRDIFQSQGNIQGQIAQSLQSETVTNLQGQVALLTAINNSTQTTGSAIDTVNANISSHTDTLSARISDVATGMLAGFSGVTQAVTNSTYAVTQAITNDGDKTRALIQSIETASLNREIVVAQNEITELRNEGRIRESGVNVTNNINQNSLMQQQQQQLGSIVGALNGVVNELQRNTQSVVNLGTMSGSAGSQTANNTRVNG